MTAPIPFTVTRYRCPHCPRTGSSQSRVSEHIGRCWSNPAARGCKTCRHFQPATDDHCGAPHGCGACRYIPEACAVGVDLTGRPAFSPCATHAETDPLGVTGCPECSGDGQAVQAGPIVNCEKWEALA